MSPKQFNNILCTSVIGSAIFYFPPTRFHKSTSSIFRSRISRSTGNYLFFLWIFSELNIIFVAWQKIVLPTTPNHPLVRSNFNPGTHCPLVWKNLGKEVSSFGDQVIKIKLFGQFHESSIWPMKWVAIHNQCWASDEDQD